MHLPGFNHFLPIGTVLYFSLFCDSTSGILVSDPEALTNKSYDFIVVGAGTAGCVIASRLSEDASVKVLVIEAGSSDDADVIRVPFFAGQGVGTVFDWNYTTTVQEGLNGRSIDYPRGRVIGGSSSINNMVYIRGPAEDFNRMAKVTGDRGWAWRNLWPYILKNEKHAYTWNHLDDSRRYEPKVHGFGPLLSSLTGTLFDLDFRVLNTTRELAEEFPFNLDLNSGNGLGFGWLPSSVGNSERSSSATAYLKPALASRTNIDLLLHTQATRLIQTDQEKAAFRRVEVSQGSGKRRFTFTARKEVILSAGSIGTPQLLMLSGIGSRMELAQVGVKPLVDLPDVGRNLQDQPIFILQWSVNGHTLNPFLNNQTALAEELLKYKATRDGLFASSCVPNTIGFLRVPKQSFVMRDHKDPSAGPHSPHFSIAFLNAFVPNVGQLPPTAGDWISASILLQTPTSRGSVSLNSSSSFQHPLIDPLFLDTTWDIGVTIEAVKTLQRFMSASSWRGFIKAPFRDNAELQSDDEIENFVRKWATTVKHPVGTAKMSGWRDDSGVVNPDLTVKKTEGLVVADASVIPFAPGGFPQAQVYLVAERAADLIKFRHKSQSRISP